MIQSTELRIGNYVLYFRESVFSEVREISTIHGDNTARLKDEDSSIGCFKLSKLKPIPLTEEWLLKFGFKKVDYRTNKEAEFDEWILGDFGFIENENGYEFYPYLTTLKHVHQLQNLYFALTGEELTINQ